MKSYKYYIIGALLIMMGSACKKDIFNLSPTDELSPASFWKTSSDATAGLTGCYSNLWDITNYVLPYLDVLTPNAYSNYPWEGWQGIAWGNATPDGPGGIPVIWEGAYSGIGRTNVFLANIGNVEMDATLKARMIGEAKFLRALYYFNLINYYGGVPLITTPPDLSQATQPRATVDQVRQQILKDLDDAAAVLPAAPYTGSDIGRATEGAALALKTRVLLYNGQWADAAAAAKSVMTLAGTGYALFPSYRGLFLPANENNSEVIFDVQFESTGKFSTNWDILLGIYNALYTPGWSSIEPTEDFVDTYDMKDGSTYSPTNPLADPTNKYNNRDPRMDQTIFRPGVNYEGLPYPVDSKGFAGIYTGFSFKKYTVYDNAPTPVVTENKSYINGILLRYADVLLMYAEAQNEASGPDASVYDAIRQVRQRAGITQPNLPAGLSQSEMRAKIMHERRIEFVGEGLYFSDVRRWGTANVELNRAVQLNGSYKAGIMDIRKYDPKKNNLFPIPQHEIDNSQKAITQNPGY
ncbi:RagB/SusD family nutrient uptake outer membrane protein [Mucilaginibacter sp. X5P1]|uniref:RagB/SusD family nutrient uptake outer membrane protein n=1 Tax=Mucilaginibacter sp. X5P1 TaxID=2723088 RepID=UPI0016203275|nr:RagB/SusD family nutrient uptake outer membrane protein [Mucilaginibacter sp. X5P1]MBB6140926.1 hypothetical protein [Mucilaginibacter sp. X5P1]